MGQDGAVNGDPSLGLSPTRREEDGPHRRSVSAPPLVCVSNYALRTIHYALSMAPYVLTPPFLYCKVYLWWDECGEESKEGLSLAYVFTGNQL